MSHPHIGHTSPLVVGHQLTASRAGGSRGLLALEQTHGVVPPHGWGPSEDGAAARGPAWGLDPLFVARAAAIASSWPHHAIGDVPRPAGRAAQLGRPGRRVPRARARPGDRQRAVHPRELVVLLAGLVVTMGANLVLVRRAFAPLERLTRLMRTVDPLAPGHARSQSSAGAARGARARRRVQRHARAPRGRAPRERPPGRSRAQEAERRRVARELHDELGQSLTGVLLQIDEAIRAPEEADLEEAREDVRRSLDDVRRIARDLRPDTLDELGLRSALNAPRHALHRARRGLAVDRRLDDDLPAARRGRRDRASTASRRRR